MRKHQTFWKWVRWIQISIECLHHAMDYLWKATNKWAFRSWNYANHWWEHWRYQEKSITWCNRNSWKWISSRLSLSIFMSASLLYQAFLSLFESIFRQQWNCCVTLGIYGNVILFHQFFCVWVYFEFSDSFQEEWNEEECLVSKRIFDSFD